MQVINLVEEEEKAARWMELTAPAEPKDFIKENKEGRCVPCKPMRKASFGVTHHA